MARKLRLACLLPACRCNKFLVRRQGQYECPGKKIRFFLNILQEHLNITFLKNLHFHNSGHLENLKIYFDRHRNLGAGLMGGKRSHNRRDYPANSGTEFQHPPTRLAQRRESTCRDDRHR